MNCTSLLWIAAIAAVAAALLGVMRPGAPLLFGGLRLLAMLDDYSRVSVQTVVMLGLNQALGRDLRCRIGVASAEPVFRNEILKPAMCGLQYICKRLWNLYMSGSTMLCGRII